MKPFLISAVLISLAAPAAAQHMPTIPSIHFAPFENLERMDVALINSAQTSIDMAAYVLTDVVVIDALVAAGERGVAVRILRDPSQEGRGAPVLAALERLNAAPNITLRTKKPGPFMHLKLYILDGKTLRTGAANFSASGLKQQDNDLLVLDDPRLVSRAAENFEKMWSR